MESVTRTARSTVLDVRRQNTTKRVDRAANTCRRSGVWEARSEGRCTLRPGGLLVLLVLRDITLSPTYCAICGYTETHSPRPYAALAGMAFDALRAALDALFAGIPHRWHTRNPMSEYEGWYASVFYGCFASLGLDVRAEDGSSAGQLDMAVQVPGHDSAEVGGPTPGGPCLRLGLCRVLTTGSHPLQRCSRGSSRWKRTSRTSRILRSSRRRSSDSAEPCRDTCWTRTPCPR